MDSKLTRSAAAPKQSKPGAKAKDAAKAALKGVGPPTELSSE
jgi:hypothetical protein